MTNSLDRKTLINQLIPTVNIIESPTELKIESNRLDTPKFIKCDNDLACRECSKTDYLVSKDGVYIRSKRLKDGEKFVSFDHIYEIPQYCAFGLRSRRLFRFPYVFSHQNCKPMRKRPVKHQEKQESTPIITGILPNLSSMDQSEEEPSKEATTTENAQFAREHQENAAPILTTILPHLIPHHEEMVKPRSDDAPILTTVLPHLLSRQQEMNKEEKKTESDEIPILTTLMPHLISPHEQQEQEMMKKSMDIKEEVNKEEWEDKNSEDEVPILTTLLPHLESHL